MTKNVLATKSAFLRIKSTPLSTDFGNGLAPRLVFDASSDVVANGDAVADDAMDTDPDHCLSDHVDPHMAHLANEAKAIFPYTIRYVDLTVLKLKADLRVPQLILFRNEWGTLIDIFNNSEKGIEGSAVFTGQPGIGEHHYWYLTVTSNRTRENMPVVFHPYPLHRSCPVNCVPGYVRQGLHH